jgi:hypothetical protein
LSGGVEEAWRSLQNLPAIDPDGLVEYVRVLEDSAHAAVEGPRRPSTQAYDMTVALNPIVVAEKVVRSFLRYRLNAYPFADAQLHGQMRRLPALEYVRLMVRARSRVLQVRATLQDSPPSFSRLDGFGQDVHQRGWVFCHAGYVAPARPWRWPMHWRGSMSRTRWTTSSPIDRPNGRGRAGGGESRVENSGVEDGDERGHSSVPEIQLLSVLGKLASSSDGSLGPLKSRAALFIVWLPLLVLNRLEINATFETDKTSRQRNTSVELMKNGVQ